MPRNIFFLSVSNAFINPLNGSIIHSNNFNLKNIIYSFFKNLANEFSAK